MKMDKYDLLKKCNLVAIRQHGYQISYEIDFSITAYTRLDYDLYKKLFSEMMEDKHTYEYVLENNKLTLINGFIKNLVEKDNEKSITFIASMMFDVFSDEKAQGLGYIQETLNEKRLRRIFR